MRQHRRILALWFSRLPTDRLLRRATGAPKTDNRSQFGAPLIISHKANNALYIYALEARSDFETATWDLTGDTFTAANSAPAFSEKDLTTAHRFFRVKAE